MSRGARSVVALGCSLAVLSSCSPWKPFWPREEHHQVRFDAYRYALVRTQASTNKQGATHGELFGNDWYHVRSELTVGQRHLQRAWLVEAVADMNGVSSEARAARSRHFELRYTKDGDGVLLSDTGGASWMFAYVTDAVGYFNPRWVLPAAAAQGSAVELGRRVLRADLGLEPLPPSDLSHHDWDSEWPGQLLEPRADENGNACVADPPMAMLAQLPYDGALEGAALARLEQDHAGHAQLHLWCGGVRWLVGAAHEHAATRAALVAKLSAASTFRSAALASVALASELPEQVFPFALARLTAASSAQVSDARGDSLWLAWALAKMGRAQPQLVEAHLADVQKLVERFASEPSINARRPALYGLFLLALTPSPRARALLEEWAKTSDAVAPPLQPLGEENAWPPLDYQNYGVLRDYARAFLALGKTKP